MRFAYVSSIVPRRRELASGPIDAEWVVDERGSNEVVVFVDYESDGTDLLHEAGVEFHVAPKRTVIMAGDQAETSEELQARLLMQRHAEAPFDAIIYDSAHATDWAWYQPQLAAIPRGVALGAGPARDVRLVTSVPDLFARHGRTLWAMTGTLASADFLISDVGADAYGIDPTRLPPRFSLNPLPTAVAPSGPAGLVALVALSESPTGLATVVERGLAQVTTDENTVMAVIHPDVAVGSETTRDIVFASLPASLRGRVRLAEPSSDGVADGLLAQADVVVAARVSDLAVRAVSDAAAKVGSVVLEGTGFEAPRFGDGALRKAEHPHPVLIAVDGPLDALIPVVDEIIGEAAAVVLHTDNGSWSARRLWKLPGSARGGLLLVCDPLPYHGEPDPSKPAFDLIGFDAASWPSIRRIIQSSQTLHDVVEMAASIANAHRVNLLALPVMGIAHGRLKSQPEAPAWITDSGSLPQPVLGTVDSDGSDAPEVSTAGVKEWAESHGFRDRIRLALPWKWGILNRAMRDRW
ncbi:MAG: hypothetical protein OER12_00615 [Acidimicrobiia bacterium]|nr:hypothetical protein [Acidimicrobiia bacterium]